MIHRTWQHPSTCQTAAVGHGQMPRRAHRRKNAIILPEELPLTAEADIKGLLRGRLESHRCIEMMHLKPFEEPPITSLNAEKSLQFGMM